MEIVVSNCHAERSEASLQKNDYICIAVCPYSLMDRISDSGAKIGRLDRIALQPSQRPFKTHFSKIFR